MVTEILGIVIVIGAVMVLLLRYFMAKREAAKARDARVKQQEVGQAAVELRRELEKAADAIIERMGERVDHLEQLIAEAGRREAALRARIRELEAKETQIPETSFAHALAKHMDEAVEMPLPAHTASVAPADTKVEAAPSRGAERGERRILPAPVETPPVRMEEPRTDVQGEMERSTQEEAAETASVSWTLPLREDAAVEPYAQEEKIAVEEVRSAVETAEQPPRTEETEEMPVATAKMREASQISAGDEAEPGAGDEAQMQDMPAAAMPQAKAPSSREVAAALLQDGMDVEEVARATGIERSALELLRRMPVK